MNQETARKLLEKTKQDYDQIAELFSSTRFNLWKEFDQFLKFIKDGDQILDMGCGNGRLFKLLKDLDIKYIGVDGSSKLIHEASEKFSKYKEKCQFKVGDILDPNYGGLGNDETNDIVFLIAVLHHIPTKELQLKVLQNINQVLKKNGYLIMTNWNLYQSKYFPYLYKKYFSKEFLNLTGFGFKDALIPWKELGKEIYGDLPEEKKIMWRYYRAFTLRELTKLVKKSGFKIVDKYYVRSGDKVRWLKSYNIVVIAQKC